MIDLRQDPSIIDTYALDPKEVRRVMHAITPEGEVLIAMEALRATMRAIGRGWMLAWTRIPVVSWVCDRFYMWFARNRLRFFRVKEPCNDACSIDETR
jgi:predicted DCC family thiol-disulfide oxidoreductase YuxK